MGDEISIRNLVRDSLFETNGGLPALALQLAKANAINVNSFDNDGVAIFWRRERFEATSIEYHDRMTALKVLLRDLNAHGEGPHLSVSTTHLSSGASQADEERRVSVC